MTDVLTAPGPSSTHRDCGPEGPTYAERIRVDPLAPGDVATVQRVFDGLGPKSRELRFLTAKPRLTGPDLRALSDVDGRDRVALVARHDGCAIGIARFVRDEDEPAAADVAIAVVDAWQDRWVGTRLAHALVDRARQLGISHFTMSMAQDNDAALRLLHGIAHDVTRVGFESGSVEFVASLAASSGRPSAVLKCART
jgi:ribosomal protein S18 acetylase RimI-like enzyme